MPPSATARVPGPSVLPGALSPLTADLVRGARRPAVVLGAGRYGVYLGVADRVLPVLAADALALPSAVRLAERSATLDLAARPGDVVLVGAGVIRLRDTVVRGVRTWRPRRVAPGAAPRRAAVAGVRELLASALAPTDPPTWLGAAVASALTDDTPTGAVRAMVGRGPGLTPSGDDALAGALLVRRGCGAVRRGRGADALTAAVRAGCARTTAVSAALLDAAADGWAAPEVVDLVDAVARGDADAVRTALPAVLAVGHTSGRDLVVGMDAALGALVAAGEVAA